MINNVQIKTRDGVWTYGDLLEFTTIPVETRGSDQLKVLVYGIVWLDNGEFHARPLNDIFKHKPLEQKQKD